MTTPIASRPSGPGLAFTVGALLLSLVLTGMFAGVSPVRAGEVADTLPGDSLTVVRVDVGDEAERERLLATGLDIVDHSTDSAEIFLHGEEEAATLRRTGLDWAVIDHDRSNRAAALDRVHAEEEARQQALEETAFEEGSDLPTGRVAYRTLEDIEADLHDLAEAYPDRVKLFELPHTSLLGKTIRGVEISHDVHVESGKPVFLNTGLHHVREWPTAELTLEFAWDVLESDGEDPRITSLLEDAKMIVVPVVNPDGYEMSRSRIHEQKRKNCRMAPGEIPTWEECAADENANRGVDINRNYGAFWGGPGSSGNETSGTYRGEAPYSEPEVQNIVELTAAHQVMVAIHNHTPDGRLLRAPSSPEEPAPADEEMYDALAQELGDALDWPAGPWTEIYYDASGVAEQHAYYSAGIFGFTTEATPGHSGLERFHPPYEYVIDQYLGTGSYEGSNMREAYLLAWEAAADADQHSVISGTAPRGIELTIEKDSTVYSSPGAGVEVTIDDPSAAAGSYEASGAEFGPAFVDVGSADVVVVDDGHDEPGDYPYGGTGSPTEGCGPLIDFPAGAIALVDRGRCLFVDKVKHAQDAGAAGVIVANNTGGSPTTMTGSDASITIPSVMVSQTDGDAIKAGLPATGSLQSEVIPSELEIESSMVVPASGEFDWHVLPSLRPSQSDSTHLLESWTVSCRTPSGRAHEEVEVTVARGESVDVDMSDCPGGPKRNPRETAPPVGAGRS